MANCKPAATQMEVNLKLKKLETAEIDTTAYQQLIRSVMYTSIGTHFDITYDVGVLSQHNHTAAKWVFCYLQGTTNNYILYNGNSNIKGPIVYCNADWASNPSDQKSISGYTAIISGAAISWSLRKTNDSLPLIYRS